MKPQLSSTNDTTAFVEQMEAMYDRLRSLYADVGRSDSAGLFQPVREGTRLTVRLTHEDIANVCCSTRVTMTRLLGNLQRQGKLTIDRRSHIVLHKGF